MSLTLVVAATVNNGIGQGGKLPWKLAREMAYFKRVTSAAPAGSLNVVIMGRNTWESIPMRFRPLPERLNIVLTTRDIELTYAKPPARPAVLAKSVPSALSISVDQDTSLHRRFLIGGAKLYAECLDAGHVERILLTRILSPTFEDCDVVLPDLGRLEILGWEKAGHEALQEWVGFDVPSGVQSEDGVEYEYQMWVRSDKKV